MTIRTPRLLAALCVVLGLTVTASGQLPEPTAPARLRLLASIGLSYFDDLAKRPDVAYAHPLASQAELQTLAPRQKPYDPVAQKKRPVVYDAEQRAFRFDFHPVESTDSQQLWPSLGIKAGESAFIAFDMRLSPEMSQRTATDWSRHKAQQLDGPGGAAWLTLRTFYDAARQANLTAGGEPWRVAYWVVTANAATSTIPQRLGSTEYVEPRQAQFYVRANRWARVAILLVDKGAVKDSTAPLSDTQRAKFPDGRVMELSYWMSDEDRDPVQILDRALVLQPYTRIDLLRFEWDTGTDNVRGDDRYGHAWHRNLIALRNPPLDTIPTLLLRPAA